MEVPTWIKNSRVYRWGRYLRHGLRHPEWIARIEREARFYAQFVRRGDLCFDVGANVGQKTDIFLHLGARVVAVEPTPTCIELLRSRFSKQDVTIEAVGAAEAEGEAIFYLADSSTVSSMLPDWLERNPSQLSDKARRGEIRVPITTLDHLIERHGMPQYCKIDVEGFEVNVLQGLTKPLACLSFEYTKDNLAAVEPCLLELRRLGRYEFNYTLSTPLKLRLDSWVDSDLLMDHLGQYSPGGDGEGWGDVFARRVSTP